MQGILPWLFISTLALLALAILGWWRATTRISRRNSARQHTAREGELSAETLLIQRGFRITGRQVTQPWEILVNKTRIAVFSRADLMVSDGRRSYVAEVKTGDYAPNPSLPSTRRQLLEYALAFPVDGVLLVDIQQGEIHRVEFPSLFVME